MREIWKTIDGFEYQYEVSNTGKVKSLQRKSKYKKQFRLVKERILKPVLNEFNYHSVQLYNCGKPKRFKIHRLVATAFLENPQNKPHINHIDNNPENNKLNNLEWCTPSENIQHSYDTNRRVKKTHAFGKSSIRVAQIDILSNAIIKVFSSIKSAEKETSIVHIADVCKNRKHRNTAGGYLWKKHYILPAWSIE